MCYLFMELFQSYLLIQRRNNNVFSRIFVAFYLDWPHWGGFIRKTIATVCVPPKTIE